MYPAEEKTPSRAFSLFLFTYPSGSFLASPPAAAASAIVPGALRCDEPTRKKPARLVVDSWFRPRIPETGALETLSRDPENRSTGFRAKSGFLKLEKRVASARRRGTSRRARSSPDATMPPRDGPGPFANAIGIAAGITLGGVIVKVRVRLPCVRPAPVPRRVSLTSLRPSLATENARVPHEGARFPDRRRLRAHVLPPLPRAPQDGRGDPARGPDRGRAHVPVHRRVHRGEHQHRGAAEQELEGSGFRAPGDGDSPRGQPRAQARDARGGVVERARNGRRRDGGGRDGARRDGGIQ